MEATTFISEEGTEYVIRGGELQEKCLHKTRTDESTRDYRKEVCHDCKKVLIYNENKTREPSALETFRDFHGREPRGEELFGLM